MRNTLLILLVLSIPFVGGCKKESNDLPADYKTPLTFTSLTASDTLIAIAANTTLTATATGDGLTYTWAAEFGTIFGSGAVVDWNVCHSDNFTINCEVQDQYGDKLSKSIVIHVKP
jgi:hypothetical protein